MEGTVKADISRWRKIPPAGRPTNCEPSGAGRSWKEGARERADDVFFTPDIKRRRSKADFAPTWRRRGDSNPRTVLPAYSLSRGAPYSHLGTSAWL